MRRALVTGASGFIGKSLISLLIAEGWAVTSLTRDAAKAALALGTGMEYLAWAETGAVATAVADADAVFHLAGASVAGQRWTPEYKREIRDSRLETTRAIVAAKPRTLLCASAIGYYGDQGEKALTEDAPAGDDFLADVCRRWEDAAQAAETTGCRVARIRIGQVVGKGGGMLEAMLHPPVVPFSPWKLGVGGPLGDGRQWVSWIQLSDVVRLFLWCAENESATGAYNATAPEPVTNAAFSRELGMLLHRPSLVPVPAFALRALLGEFADSILASQRVLPRRALDAGFTFRYADLAEALQASL